MRERGPGRPAATAARVSSGRWPRARRPQSLAGEAAAARCDRSVDGMDEALHLISLAQDQVARAERLLATADEGSWTGPSARLYAARLDQRRAECAALRASVEQALAALAAVRAA